MPAPATVISRRSVGYSLAKPALGRESSLEGLSQTEADARLKKFGLNLVARES